MRAALITVGTVTMGYALLGAATDPDLKPGGVVLFLVATLVAHDAVLLPVTIAAGAFLLICYLVGRVDYSSYLGIPHVPGAGELDDAKKFSGKVPADGEYVIVVGPTRGNATYKLSYSVK